MRFPWLVPALLSYLVALWFGHQQGDLLPQDVALHYLRGLDVMEALRAGAPQKALGVAMQPLPNPGTLGAWIGLWMALLGPSPMVALGSLLPLHLGMAWGLWRGGEQLGGRWGGPAATLLGMTLPVGVQQAASIHPDFVLMAGSAMMAGALLTGRDRLGGWALAMATAGKLAALPSLVGMIADGTWRKSRWSWLLPVLGVLLLLYLPHVGELGSYAAGSDAIAAPFRGLEAMPRRLAAHLQNLGRVGSPAMLLGIVGALLLRRDGGALRPLGWGVAGMVGISLLEHQPQERYMLPMMMPLVLATVAVGGSRRGNGVLALGILLHLAFLSQPSLWKPMLLRPPDFDRDGVLDWLTGKAAEQHLSHPRVALQVEPGGPLSGPAFVIRSRERGLDLSFVVVEEKQPLAEQTDLAVILDLAGREERAGWQAFLPPPTESHPWPGDYTLQLWDRGLPLEPKGDDRSQHPANQALYLLWKGQIQGPLLSPASSVEVVHSDRWHVLFVREQQLWAAESDDGIAWETPQKLGIAGFDPSLTAVPGGWRLFVARLTGAGDDPAKHPTAIHSYTSTNLRDFVEEPGVRLEGQGIVDPSLLRQPNRWELYYTEAGHSIRRALSGDGMTFQEDPSFRLLQATVPLALPEWLIVQRFIGEEPVLFRMPRQGDRYGAPTSLEVCGTGPSRVEDRLYFSRDPGLPACAKPTIWEERRPSL